MADQAGSSAGTTTASASVAQPGWMRNLQQTCKNLVKLLPTSIAGSSTLPINESANAREDPLTRFYRRESEIGQKLLKQVLGDLLTLIACCKGEIKQTNHIRELIEIINKGGIPVAWQRYKFEEGISLMQWTSDFARRLKQLEAIEQKTVGDERAIWLGGLFRPAGWITATRQRTAHREGVSLEALQLELKLGSHDHEGYALQSESLYMPAPKKMLRKS